MNRIRKMTAKLLSAGLGLSAFALLTTAQAFTYTNNDLVLGFRKTGVHAETHEAVVNIGPVTNYLNLSPGNTMSVPGFTPAQLVPDSFSSFNYLNWSVNGFSKTNTVSLLPGYVNNTLWLTVPRSSTNIQSAPPLRMSYSSQGNPLSVLMTSIRSGAAYYSQSPSNQDNTVTFVREPVNDSANLSVYITSTVDPNGSTFHDAWSPNVENITPASFSGSVVSDLYEVRPLTDAQGNPVTDPHTGQTSGDAYYVGYFQFNSSGTMTFTRATASVTPPAPTLSVTRAGNISTISFLSANGATYTLHYTNSAGLTTPVASWPAAAPTITGNGGTKQFIDTTTDDLRFYRVGAQ